MSASALRDRPPRRLLLSGEEIQVRVRESQRARMTRLIIGPRWPLEVIVPKRVSSAEIDRFLESKRAWIERKLAQAREITARPRLLGLDRPGVVWLEGEALPIERRNGRRSVAESRDGGLIVAGPSEGFDAAIERWYRREARRRILDVVSLEAERLGLEYGSVGIRDPRTRWGSCSRRGNLSFSWRLLLAPPEVLEYVVVHELCHLRVPNHSKAFWRTLEAARPGWQEQARWLREHGQELHDYSPTAGVPATCS